MTDTTFNSRSYAFQPYVDCKNWIGGEWGDAASGKTHPVMNPRHEKAMGNVVWSDGSDIERAVAAAKAAFPAWRDTPLKERAQVLYRVKQIMTDKLDELAWLLSHENGKTIAQAKGSVLKGIECVEFSIGNWSDSPHLDAAALLDSDAARKDLKARLAHHGVTISAFNANGTPYTEQGDVANLPPGL